MVPDLTLEVIYYGVTTDFKMEFDLCGCCSMRFLSALVHDTHSFLVTLNKSVARSRVIVTVGGFEGKVFLPFVVGKATGIPKAKIDKELYGIKTEGDVVLLKNSIPLVTVDGRLAGLVLESGDQSIIMLSEDYNKRQEVVKNLVCPYICHLANQNCDMGSACVTSTKNESSAIGQCGPQGSALAALDSAAKNQAVLAPKTAPSLNPQNIMDTGVADKLKTVASQSELPGEPVLQNTQTYNTPTSGQGEVPGEIHQSSEQAVTSGDLQATSPQPDDLTKKADQADMPSDFNNAEPKNTAQATTHDVDKAQDLSQTGAPVPTGDTGAEISPAQSGVSAAAMVESSNEDESQSLQTTNIANSNAAQYTVLQEESKPGLSYISNLEDLLLDEWEPEEPKVKNKRKVLKTAIALLLVILVLLGSFFGYQRFYRPMQGSMVYQKVVSLYGQKGDEELPAGMLSKFGKLYKLNSDLVGWLSLPNTNINYPVVTSAKKSAVYYSTHLFDGSLNDYGTLYTPEVITSDSYIRNLVIYGKDLSNNTMFSDLAKYKDLEFYRSAPVIAFDTIYTENYWKIFSVFGFTGSAPVLYTQSKFFTDEDFAFFVQQLKSASLIQTSVDLKQTDEILTLVAKGEGRTTVVVARKVRPGESTLVDVTGSRVVDDTSSPASGATTSAATSSNKLIDLGEIPKTINTESRYEQKDPGQNQSEIASNIAKLKPKPITPSSSSTGAATSKASSHHSSHISTSAESHGSHHSTSSTSSTPQYQDKLPTLTVTNILASPKTKVSGPAVEIIASILEAEMGSSFHIEALKAQAVAAYSWLLCNGAATGKAPEVPMKPAGKRCQEAAEAVAGVCAVYNGTIAQTYYYAISAGRSANCEDIWTASLPYLKSVDSSVDKNASGYQTIRTYRASDVQKWVLEQTGIDLSSISDKSKWFKPQYDANGLYVKTVLIGDKSFKGTYLREKLFTADRVGASNVLRSSAYTITYNKSDDTFTFVVKGYGHGVGMSQVGANAYAKSGWNYEQILKHYYTGITLGTYFVN